MSEVTTTMLAVPVTEHDHVLGPIDVLASQARELEDAGCFAIVLESVGCDSQGVPLAIIGEGLHRRS